MENLQEVHDLPSLIPSSRFRMVPGGELAPFVSARAHLETHLHRVVLCWERWRRLRRKDGIPRSIAGGGEAGETDEQTPSLAQLHAAIRHVDDVLLAQSGQESELPIALLQRRFSLSHLEIRALLLAAASSLIPELSFRISEILRQERGSIPVRCLLEIVTEDEEEREELHTSLGPHAPLLRWQLLSYDPSQGFSLGVDSPTLHRSVFVPTRIVDWLRGQTDCKPARLAHAGRLHSPQEAGTLQLPASMEQALLAALFRSGCPPYPILGVIGAAKLGKASAVTLLVARRGQATLEVDLERVMQAAEPAVLLCAALREARLQQAVLLLRRAELLTDVCKEFLSTLRTALRDAQEYLPIVLTVRGRAVPSWMELLAAEVVILPWPSEAEQLRIWRQALAQTPLECQVDLAALVRQYPLTAADIMAAVTQASQAETARRQSRSLCPKTLAQAAQSRLLDRLADLAELGGSTDLSWDDLILEEDHLHRIFELIAVGRHSDQVLRRWGFGKQRSTGHGISALISGPPGTGKTTVALLIAKTLGRELFRVDASFMAAKWRGPYEKNLEKLFEEAEHAQAVLLLEEVDAILGSRPGRRTPAGGGSLDQNLLRCKLESFSSVLLFTTYNASSLDPDLRRKMRFHIELGEPTLEEGERLWQAMLPECAPLSADIDVSALAGRYPMSGGSIKNAALRAAYLAAASGCPEIDQACLEEAARLEWEDMGRL